ncbi:hypothetical protein NE237_028881 [Protea cynaroides]|uniref:NAC domain-containing protein n=1 Tax=Protea cynaroides TaxID=273540 RepID=A0A9Q0GR42_9MAGN|nr:hypothetical protein NE237_028881 [Protea cynaroides]
MERMFRQPGFRFHPTDVELVQYYLKRKLMGKRFDFEAIGVLDLYKFDPWVLPAKSCQQSRDREWYFFCPRARKYSNGSRANRATEHGFWKSTGKDRPICYDSKTVGMKRTLVFHEGRAPRGQLTNWVMYEYRLEDKDLVAAGVIQDAYVLCKIFEKSGRGPKNGEQYGAPYREEDWEDEVMSNSVALFPTADPGSLSIAQAEEHFPLSKDNDIVSLLDMFEKDDDTMVSNGNENLDNSNVDESTHLDCSGIYNGLEDLGSASYLKTTELHFPGSLETEYALDQKLLEDDTSFLELIDLDYPLDYPLFNEGSQVEDQLPPYPQDKGSEGDISHGNEAAKCNVADCSSGKAEERGTLHVRHAPARGEWQSALNSLLESIPTRPASATEYPSPTNGGKKGGCILSPYGGSSIHVEAEVTVIEYGCTDDALLDKLGEFPCMCCGYNVSRKEPGMVAATSGSGGFLFIFFFGVALALIWGCLVFAVAMFCKFTWNLLLY